MHPGHTEDEGQPALRAAIALTPAERRTIVEGFFALHPGPGEGRFGLGRALLDFQAWEITSGRIADDGGSDWWRGVNGLMVLDIAAASEGAKEREGARAWRLYAGADGDAQRAVWEAHQRSLHTALHVCRGLLERETAAEQEFAGIVIDVVDRTALAGTATDTPGLALLTSRFYPASYPISPEALPALRAMRERTADRLRDPEGTTFANVGMHASRWG